MLKSPAINKFGFLIIFFFYTIYKFFRITVQGGGCSGFKYNFGFDSKANDDDVIFDRAIIDKSSLEIISGSVVDFKKEMIGESFVIKNPKATASCGCGLSFSV